MTSLLIALCFAATDKPVISVTYFENRTADPAYDVMSKGLAEMMITDLVAWDGVTVVERAKLESVLTELSLQQTRAFDPATRAKVGTLLGAKYVITGSLLPDGKTGLIVDARIVDVGTGRDLGSARAADQKDRIFDLEQRLVEQLTEQIDLKITRKTERRKAFVPSMSVLLAYSNGLELADQGKLAEADQALFAVVSKNPLMSLARETRMQLLEKLEASKRRGQDLTAASFAELARRSDEALKDSSKVDQRVAWMLVRSAVLTHTLEQLATLPRKEGKDETGGTRVISRANLPQGTKVLEALFENELALLEANAEREPQARLTDPAVISMLKDVHLSDDGSFRTGLQTMLHRVSRLVVDGGTVSGHVYPTIGSLQPRRIDDFLAVVERLIAAARRRAEATPPEKRRATEYELTSLMTVKAETLEDLDRDEPAAMAWQAILDAFPTSAGNQPERHITIIAGVEHDSHRSDVEHGTEGLRTCDDMALRLGLRSSRRYERMGLAGIEAQVAELEQACLGRPESDGTWDYLYGHLASFAAEHGDCALARALYLKQFAWGVGPRSFDYPLRAWPECAFGFAEDSFPTKVRVTRAAVEARDDPSLRRAFEALPEVLAEELGARGIAIESSGASHGGVGAVVPHFEQRTHLLTLEYRPESRDETVTSSATLADVHATLDVDAVLAPLLKSMRAGADRGPRVAHRTLSLEYLQAYADALATRDHREQQQAFEALARAWPQHRLPAIRARMAAVRAAREHH